MRLEKGLQSAGPLRCEPGAGPAWVSEQYWEWEVAEKPGFTVQLDTFPFTEPLLTARYWVRQLEN